MSAHISSPNLTNILSNRLLTQAFVRDEITAWMTLLRKCGAATDWAVVIVEAADTKKTNKLLPRTSVLDKLKADVGGKQPERCISLIGESKCEPWIIHPRNMLEITDMYQHMIHHTCTLGITYRTTGYRTAV